MSTEPSKPLPKEIRDLILDSQEPLTEKHIPFLMFLTGLKHLKEEDDQKKVAYKLKQKLSQRKFFFVILTIVEKKMAE